MNTEQINVSKKLNLIQENNKNALEQINTQQMNIQQFSDGYVNNLNQITKIDKVIEKLNLKEGRLYDNLLKMKNDLSNNVSNDVSNQTKLNIENIKKNVIKKYIAKNNISKNFLEKIIEKGNVNALIHSPTQVGKSEITIEFIKNCLQQELPVIISCDYKSDQLNEFYSRLRNNLIEYDDIILIKASNPRFNKIFKYCLKNNKNFVIFCLDNGSEISKVKEQIALMAILEKIEIIKLVLIHEEGDIITIDDEKKNKNCKEWSKMIKFFSQQKIELKRIFVTSTPENVICKYEIEDVLRLKIPQDYTGYDKINFYKLENSIDVIDVLIEEQNRRILEKENGVILYCNNLNNSDTKWSFFFFCNHLECVVNTYDENGITARVNNEKFEARLKEFVRLNNKVKRNDKIIYTNVRKNVWNIKGMTIKKFYQICKDVGSGIIVTIGMDLIARGISFVSSEKSNDAVAATTIICQPGMNINVLKLCQTIGRITGTARPDLERRLYASESVIKSYFNYNENQKKYLKEIVENDNVVSDEIMEMIELNN